MLLQLPSLRAMCISLQFYCWTKIIIKWCIWRWRAKSTRNATRWRSETRISENIPSLAASIWKINSAWESKRVGASLVRICHCNSGQYGWVDEKWDGFYLKCDSDDGTTWARARTYTHPVTPDSIFRRSLFHFFFSSLLQLLFHFYSFWIYVKRKWCRFFTMDSLFFVNRAHFALNRQEKGCMIYLQHKWVNEPAGERANGQASKRVREIE